MRLVLAASLMMIAGAACLVSAPPTYHEHIRPIVMRSCMPCHEPGGAGPFPLTTYHDVRTHGAMVAYVTTDGYMPPHRNDPLYRAFAHDRRLNPTEIASIAQWVEGGMPEGIADTTVHGLQALDAQPARAIHWDTVLSMRSSVPIPGTSRQHYICYAIPYELDAERWATAIEYIPGNRKLSHHASYQFLEVAPDVDLRNIPEYFVYSDTQYVDDGHDYAYFGLVSARYGPPRETFHGGWLPGSAAWVYPEGIGFRVPRKGVLLIRNLHYAPTPVPSSDSATVRLRFGKVPGRTILFAPFKPALAPDQQVLRAGTITTHRIVARIRDAISVLNINPHMHQLGTSFKVWAETPSGDTIPLVYIPVWDFDWQEFYRFERPVKIPAGSVLNAVATFDNTAANIRNPHRPPRDVPFEHGMDDTNEMMRLVLLVLGYQQGDEAIDLTQE